MQRKCSCDGLKVRSLFLRTAIALSATAICAAAEATIVTIDAAQYGASSASGGPNQPNVQPGAVLNNIYSPKDQLILRGTYTITNAATSGYYSAWNFQGYPSTPNWVWSFLIADDATSTVIDDGYVGGVEPTQAAMAAVHRHDDVGWDETTRGDVNCRFHRHAGPHPHNDVGFLDRRLFFARQRWRSTRRHRARARAKHLPTGALGALFCGFAGRQRVTWRRARHQRPASTFMLALC